MDYEMCVAAEDRMALDDVIALRRRLLKITLRIRKLRRKKRGLERRVDARFASASCSGPILPPWILRRLDQRDKLREGEK